MAEPEIRTLIERWAAAVHNGDIDAVVADHTADIVMYDVPTPDHVIRGIDAYRSVWPPFFQWQASGAEFAIETLDITAGADTAFAFARLRCGTAADFARDPELRLRITFGLRRVDDRWQIAHEHHSFPSAT